MPRREPGGDATFHDLFRRFSGDTATPATSSTRAPPRKKLFSGAFQVMLFFALARARLGSDHDAVTRASGARRRS